ncbi:uncharacterized protein EAE97_008999 [Botrytis byssoidea]|uniref:Uncharacterized protein n=1 Tax=Botrytis byssoidea TaxID=139641 RepID=A0A9P5IC71_9HELO|nr:uncharacterized protein EAE97_008999 [Botrytis byssoidea]KAF7931978.1 hypothetical protein EAE97_008999 [Botrytis byssoidea]
MDATNNYSENFVTQLHQTVVFSTHTRFLDNGDSTTENEAHQPQVQITRRPVETLSRFGHLDQVSRFNNLWTKKAWSSELLTLRDRQEISAISTSRIHVTEKMRKTKFKFNALPVEIREMIYEYTLLRPLKKKNKSTSKAPVFLSALKMYGTQSLYNEAKTTFHSINQFTYNIVKTIEFADREVCGMFRKLLLIIPSTFTPLSQIPTQMSLLYSSLRHLTLRKMFSYEQGGFETFITISLPKFERLICVKVECEYGKFLTSSFVQNQDRWISLLDKMITGENGESVQGIRMGDKINGTKPSTPTWVWKVENRDSGKTRMMDGMQREINLVIKHRVSHVKF